MRTFVSRCDLRRAAVLVAAGLAGVVAAPALGDGGGEEQSTGTGTVGTVQSGPSPGAATGTGTDAGGTTDVTGTGTDVTGTGTDVTGTGTDTSTTGTDTSTTGTDTSTTGTTDTGGGQASAGAGGSGSVAPAGGSGSGSQGGATLMPPAPGLPLPLPMAVPPASPPLPTIVFRGVSRAVRREVAARHRTHPAEARRLTALPRAMPASAPMRSLRIAVSARTPGARAAAYHRVAVSVPGARCSFPPC